MPNHILPNIGHWQTSAGALSSAASVTDELQSCVYLLQFDFPFIQTFRVSRFRFRLTSAFDESLGCGGGDDLIESSSEVKINTEQQLPDLSTTTSVWNCDGEVIDEPFIDFR